MVSTVQNGVVGHANVLPTILNNCTDLFTIRLVCRLWNQTVLKMPILPFTETGMRDLFTKGVTVELLQLVVKDPQALTKIYSFYMGYFTQVPEEKRIITAASTGTVDEPTLFSTRSLVNHLPVWKPYATALAILQSCHAKLPEDATALNNLESLMHPYFTEEGDQLLVDDETVVLEEKLLRDCIAPNIPRLYLTYNHSKYPGSFVPLHTFIKEKFIDVLRESTHFKSTPIAVALKCLDIAMNCLSEKNYSAELASVGQKFLAASSIPTLTEETAAHYRLKALEYFEKSKTCEP
ncbi:MAG: hypothetical protein LLF94_01395 [Chlamydiales bacterium]|nr:hypothetical protein [Chlamydiales bacterium]